MFEIKMKNQGTLSRMVDHFNQIWPFNDIQILIEDKINGTEISLIGYPDFTFEILFGSIRFISQPVVFCVMRYTIFYIVWDFEKANPIKFYIDDQEVSSIEDSKEKLVITHPPTTYINDSKTNIYNCDDYWKGWRQDLFNNRKLKKDRVLKSIDEQFEELNLSIFSLKAHLINFSTNQKLLLFNILPILRSLLYWNEKSQSYNPLLFRLAGYLNYSLPLYTLSKEARQHILHINKSEMQFLYSDSVSLDKLSPTHKQTDFQEWIFSKVIYEKSEFSYKDIIGYAANTMSFAHFDVDTYVILRGLIDKKFLQTSMLLEIITQITHLSIHFGQELINKYDKIRLAE